MSFELRLRNMYYWKCQKKLSVYCQKTVCLPIGSNHLISKKNVLRVSLNDVSIDQVHHVKYLGVLVDEKLNWNLHINIMLKKIGQMLGFLGRLRRFLLK